MLKKLIPEFLKTWYHWLWAFWGAVYYGLPSRKIKVIGVTGTNGKTTTCFLITKILEEAGYRVAMTTSIKFKLGKQDRKNKLKMTMPGHAFLQKFLRRAQKAGCDFAVLEVTSEGIAQHRHQFIDFDTAVFTNLSPEHIERHGSFENYRAAKGRFFRKVKGTHIINLDDDNADYFLKFPAEEKHLFRLNDKCQIKNVKSMTNDKCQIIKAEDVAVKQHFSSFTIHDSKFVIRLLGRFNIYNALAAVCTALSFGISMDVCKSALQKVKGMPGRMEKVISEPFEVYVDYAFTPNALKQVYKTLKNYKLQTKNYKLICVLGSCGGGRDKWKRPVLGKIAKEHCHKVIVTNEDPYDEDPMQIIDQVAEGAGKKAQKIVDRRKAIRKALEAVEPGDKVIITGKGAESWMQVAEGKKVPWDDRQVVKEEFQRLNLSPQN